MDQVCLLTFLFSGIFLIDRVHGADKTPDTFFKVTANATCGEKGKTGKIQCFAGTTCCEDKDGNAVGCMNSGQICCQGEYTAKVCDYGSKCCLDNIGRLVGCASENEKCCAGQICTVGETCCNNEQGKPYKCAAVGYTCCPTTTVTVCSPGQVCCKNSGGKPIGCAEKTDQCCNNQVCSIGQTCCPTANICWSAGETCCGSTVCSQYQVCCGAFGKACINTLEQECCNNQPGPKGKCCRDGTCADLSGELCCGLSKCVGSTCCGEDSAARCCQNGQMCCGSAYSPICCEIGERCEGGQCTANNIL